MSTHVSGQWAHHQFDAFLHGHDESEETWEAPTLWDKEAQRLGVRHRVECRGDLFASSFSLGAFADMLDLIESTPNLDWILTTGAIAQVEDALNLVIRATRGSNKTFWNSQQWLNLWLGVKVRNQAEADLQIPLLLSAPVAKRIVFVEAMEGEIDLPGMVYYGTETSGGIVPLRHKGSPQVDWVILSGGVGEDAKPMHPSWLRSIQEQCEIAEVPFFFCGWGEWVPRGPDSMGYPSIEGVPRIRITDKGQDDQDLGSEGDEPVWMQRAGPERTGRLLDGNEWNQVPLAV